MIRRADVDLFRRLRDEASNFILVTHINPDGDAIGSEYSLASHLRASGKAVRIVNQDPNPAQLRFIEPPDLAPERYDPERHDQALLDADRLILVDNSAPDRLGDMETVMRRLAEQTLCIDHHPARDVPWGDNIVDVDYCSTTAMIYDLTGGLGWTPDPMAALAIFVGLASDTGFFRFNSTNARGHEIAADLLRLGVDPALAFQELYEQNTEEYTRLLGHALTGLALDGQGAVAHVQITRQMLESLQAEEIDPTEILTTLLALGGVRVAILFRELPDNRVKVSLRSKGDLDVRRLATEFGGGGHRNASGIVMTADLAQAVATVTRRATALLDSAERSA